jgi:Domain of unknown function (DUF4157)
VFRSSTFTTLTLLFAGLFALDKVAGGIELPSPPKLPGLPSPPPVPPIPGLATPPGTPKKTNPVAVITNPIAGVKAMSSNAASAIQGTPKIIESVSEAVDAYNGQANRLSVVAAERIAGNTGKTIMTFVVSGQQLSIDFATIPAIEGSCIAQVHCDPKVVIAGPLAAAIRAAENQYLPQSKPVPSGIKQQLLLAGYPAGVLDQARWTIGSLSLSVADVANGATKAIMKKENATTVGRVTVFSRDPQDDLHWWAHELRHQWQYQQWNGIEQFAYKYWTSCHAVETDAENMAQRVAPLTKENPVFC